MEAEIVQSPLVMFQESHAPQTAGPHVLYKTDATLVYLLRTSVAHFTYLLILLRNKDSKKPPICCFTQLLGLFCVIFCFVLFYFTQ